MCRAPSPEQLIELTDGLAAEAAGRGDRPYGAVLLSAHGEVVAMASNREVTTGNPTAHAETELLRTASTAGIATPLASYTVAVNAEPCSMCASALVAAGVGGLIYRARSGAIVEKAPEVLARALRGGGG